MCKQIINEIVGRVVLAGLTLLTHCFPRKQLPTVDGPEATDLLPGLAGYIVMDRPVGGIVALSLPSCTESVVRPSHDPSPGVPHAVSGPDSQGRIAYIENFLGLAKHELHVIQLDGQNDETLFTRPGSAYFMPDGTPISKRLALAPIGGKVVFSSHLKGVQMKNPAAYLQEGSIEIWDVQQKAGHQLTLSALDAGFSWFPDGRRLAFVGLASKDQIGKLPLHPDGFGDEFMGWSAVPTVYILDTVTGKTILFHVGWQPVVSSDGKTVLLTDFANRWRLADVANHHSKSVSAPGQCGDAFALLGDGKVLYYGLPTAGSRQKKTQNNSPLVGPKWMITLKVAVINTGKFQTIIPYLDRRTKVSIGGVHP